MLLMIVQLKAEFFLTCTCICQWRKALCPVECSFQHLLSTDFYYCLLLLVT